MRLSQYTDTNAMKVSDCIASRHSTKTHTCRLKRFPRLKCSTAIMCGTPYHMHCGTVGPFMISSSVVEAVGSAGYSVSIFCDWSAGRV